MQKLILLHSKEYKYCCLCFRLIIGWAISSRMTTGSVLQSLRQSYWLHKRPQGVVFTALLGMPITYAQANQTVDEVQEVISDSWITSKVKSVFLSNTNIGGLDIKVETVDGVVALSGVVPTTAERDLAIAKAKEIKGVKGVAADGLKASR